MTIGMVLGIDVEFAHSVVIELYAVAVLVFTVGGICWASWRLIKILGRLGRRR